jgi:hypothetical protein
LTRRASTPVFSHGGDESGINSGGDKEQAGKTRLRISRDAVARGMTGIYRQNASRDVRMPEKLLQ